MLYTHHVDSISMYVCMYVCMYVIILYCILIQNYKLANTHHHTYIQCRERETAEKKNEIGDFLHVGEEMLFINSKVSSLSWNQ